MEERVLKQVVEEEEGGKSKMGEEREDPQKLKRLAADSYDYDNDSRWPDYWNNVLIPPHMASRDDVVSHFKRKFYQRYVVRFFSFIFKPHLLISPLIPQCIIKFRFFRRLPNWVILLSCNGILEAPAKKKKKIIFLIVTLD